MRELFPPGELTEFAGFVAAVNCGLVIGICMICLRCCESRSKAR